MFDGIAVVLYGADVLPSEYAVVLLVTDVVILSDSVLGKELGSIEVWLSEDVGSKECVVEDDILPGVADDVMVIWVASTGVDVQFSLMWTWAQCWCLLPL